MLICPNSVLLLTIGLVLWRSTASFLLPSQQQSPNRILPQQWRAAISATDYSTLRLSLFSGRARNFRNKNDNDRKNDKGTTTATTTTTTTSPAPTTVEWEVYVDQSKQSLERGGGATLDAFIGLANPSRVRVQPAILSSSTSTGTASSSSGGNNNNNKAPVVRCICLTNQSKSSFDVASVDSVDKVYRILAKHMGQPDVSTTVCTCLQWKYKGNRHLESSSSSSSSKNGKKSVDLAIEAYHKALEMAMPPQEGLIRTARATAYLQRAAHHQQALRTIVTEDLVRMVPSATTLDAVYRLALGTNDDDDDTSDNKVKNPALSNAILRRLLRDTDRQEAHFRQIQYRHGLYQYALLQAAADALRATVVLPHAARTWRQAADIFGKLYKLPAASQYYRRAMELAKDDDDDEDEDIQPVLEKLKIRQELLDSAKYYHEWSEDTLRLALDVSSSSSSR